MAKDGTRINVETQIFDYRGKYYFTVEKRLTAAKRKKQVFLGKFVSKTNGGKNDEAPHNCKLDTTYCLKMVKFDFPIKGFSAPQLRHFWDFFPFEGDNIREILAINIGTENFINDVNNGTIDVFENTVADGSTIHYTCMMIEPKYAAFSIDFFPSAAEKIDCMLQIISGLKQLRSAPFLNGKSVVAHRDLKFKNVMVEKKGKKRNLRLIDFPSVKISDYTSLEIDEDDDDSDGTSLGGFSQSNSAPENLISEYNISPKTDVFALGGMLAEIFKVWSSIDSHNPLYILIENSSTAWENPADFADFYRQKNKAYPYFGESTPGWLEKSLEELGFSADWDSIGPAANSIKSLFRAATVIDPEKRISFEDFETRLKYINNIILRNSEKTVKSENKSIPKTETTPMAKPKIKKQFFLFDLANLDAHKNAYYTEAQMVMKGKHDPWEIVPIRYSWFNELSIAASEDMLSDTGENNLSSVAELRHYLTNLPSYSISPSFKSPLKACIFSVLQLLTPDNEDYYPELHIFTAIPPTEENMCSLKFTDADTGKPKFLSAGEILEKHKSLKIVVHAPESAIAETEDWYTIAPFKTVIEPTKKDEPILENKPIDTPKKRKVFFRGALNNVDNNNY